MLQGTLGLAALASAVLGARAPNVTVTFKNVTSENGVFFGVDMGAHYPKFGVSALRFYTGMLEISNRYPDDAAMMAVGGAFKEYKTMLGEYYDTDEWEAGLQARHEGIGGKEADVLLLAKVARRKPTAEEKRALYESAESIYNRLVERCRPPSSKIDSNAIRVYLWDLQLGMKYKINKE